MADWGLPQSKAAATMQNNGCTSRPLISFMMYFPSNLGTRFWEKLPQRSNVTDCTVKKLGNAVQTAEGL